MNFVTVGSYDNYIAAHIAPGRLKEEFINCHLVNENSVTIYPFLFVRLAFCKRSEAKGLVESRQWRDQRRKV